MRKNGFVGMLAGLLLGASLVGVLVLAPSARADDECLVAVHDSNGDAITEGQQVCLNGKTCVFNLKACVDDEADTCTAGPFKPKKKVRAKGHCGAIGKLSVVPNGSSAVCGSTAGIKVHTKKNGKKAGNCNIRIAGKTTDGRQDIDKFTLVCRPDSDPCPTTSTTTTRPTTTLTTTTVPCPGGCAAAQIVTATAAGELVVGTLAAFPFPPGVVTTIDTGDALGNCRHDAIVPPGGFSVPNFCIPALGFTSQVIPLGCASGGSDGNGSIWDNNVPAVAFPDADISRVGDSSDGVCDPGGVPCDVQVGQCTGIPMRCNVDTDCPVANRPCDLSLPDGAGTNSKGDIDTTRGDGMKDPPGVHTRLDIPVRSRTWLPGNASCPDDDGMYNDGETLVSDFHFILSPTTATANAAFVDKNADNCSRAAGTAGPNSTRSCSGDHAKPCGAGADCSGLGTCVPTPACFINGHSCAAGTDCCSGTCVASACSGTPLGALQGSPATGPCCVVGQQTTVVATGIAFSGGGPLFDLIFANRSPTSITACNPAAPLGSCTLSADNCED